MRCALLFLTASLISWSSFCQQKGRAKTTFTASDIFQSAAFLDNKNLIPDYKGQKIIYYVDHKDIDAYFTAKGVIYSLGKAEVEKEKGKENRNEPEVEDESAKIKTSNSLAIMNWVGANPQAQIVANNKGQGYYTYLQKEGTSYKSVATEGYETITYKDLYPGIDVEYSFPPEAKGGIEYNLIVQPGADLSLVKIQYSGDIKKITTDASGNIIVHTACGDIIEHAPQTYYTNGAALASAFILKGKEFQFYFPEGYDRKQGLTIDPWVTAITTLAQDNLGFTTDFDFAGNLFVFGGGPTTDGDTRHFFKIAKYDNNGNWLWTFAGSIPAAPWNTAYNGGFLLGNYNVPGGFIVDKVTSKVYAGKGIDDNGTQTIRLDQNGNWDNFISAANNIFYETWGFAYNCANSSILAIGGGSSSNLNMGVINTTTAALATSNITGLPGGHQDIICGTYDSSGNLYVIANSNTNALPYTNTLYRVNNTINGNVWVTNSGFFSFTEHQNTPYWTNADPAGNWFNALAANGSYLYYYDGSNIAAYNLGAGYQVGNTYTIPGYNTLYQGGIAVDNCNNVYVGGVGVIKVFAFDGANFNPDTDIPLGGVFSNTAVHDVKYDANNNLLYVAGNGVVGTYTAAPSVICNPVANYIVSTSHTCDSATVYVSPSAALNPKVFSYIWSDTANNIIGQLSNTTDTVFGISGLCNGKYRVQVQWNSNCGGSAVSDSAVINCIYPFTHSNDTSVCTGQPVSLSAMSTQPGGTYSWFPGGATATTINVTPAVSTPYIVTYTPTCGAPVIDTIHVTVTPGPVITPNDTSVCSGQMAVLSASVSIPGGTYSWSPGGFNTDTATLTPNPGTVNTYTLTYSVPGCSPVTGTVTITAWQLPSVTATVDTGQCVTLIVATGTGGLSPYQYALNNGAFQVSDTFNNLAAGNYTTSVEDAHGCTSSFAVNINQSSAIALNVDTIDPGCNGGNTGVLIALATGGSPPYQYAINSGVYQVSDTFNNLAPGPYAVTAQDKRGCTSSLAVSISPTFALGLSVDTVTVACNGASTGSIVVLVTGGTLPYQYSVNNGAFQVSDTFNKLAAGSYALNVKDARGCADSSSLSISQPPAFSISFDTVEPLCNGVNNGVVVVQVTGASPPYQYALNNGSYQASDTFKTITAGGYTANVQDVHGCFTSSPLFLGQPPALSVILDTVNVGCGGPNSGAIVVNTAGGTPPYQYSLNSRTTQPSDSFLNLSVGAYSVTVSDVNNCNVKVTGINLRQVTDIAIGLSADSLQCNGANDGAIIATITGGSLPFEFSLNNGPVQSSDTFTGLAAGMYSVNVLDASGCNASTTIPVGQPAVLTLSLVPTGVLSPGDQNGSFVDSSSGGTPPYTFSATSDGAIFHYSTNNVITGLDTGTYSVIAADNNGCIITVTGYIPNALIDSFSFISDTTSCFGLQYTDGAIHVIPLSNTNVPYQYSLNNSQYQYSPDFPNLAQGAYNIIVMNTLGCTTQIPPVNVYQPANGIATVYPTDTTMQLGQSIQLTSAFGPFSQEAIVSYLWTPSLGANCIYCPDPVIESYGEQNVYTLTITYNTHCTASADVTILVQNHSQVFIPNSFTPNGDGNNDVFYVYGSSIKTVDMKIFNRWGELVFASTNLLAGWDGTYKGVLQQPGVFTYEVEITLLDDTQMTKNGSVTLLR